MSATSVWDTMEVCDRTAAYVSFQLCHEDDVRLFAFIIPDIYSQVTAMFMLFNV